MTTNGLRKKIDRACYEAEEKMEELCKHDKSSSPACKKAVEKYSRLLDLRAEIRRLSGWSIELLIGLIEEER